ncbi:MAG: hypothetical protein AAB350_00650 [Patescibacteria group bacterium]
MTTIVIFGSSLFMALILLLTKAMELKYGNKNIILRFIGKLDSKFETVVSNLKFRGLQLTQSIRYIFLVQAKEICKDCFKKIEEKAVNEFKKRQDVIMGKKEIASKGSVSFYLKKITEDKGNGEKGKIEDSL